jgi:hypothetical protein
MSIYRRLASLERNVKPGRPRIFVVLPGDYSPVEARLSDLIVVTGVPRVAVPTRLQVRQEGLGDDLAPEFERDLMFERQRAGIANRDLP